MRFLCFENQRFMIFRFIFYIQPETPYVENFFSTSFSTQRNQLSQRWLDTKM